MAPLAMEMVRDIDEGTVDFKPNYDGRSQEPVVLPAVFPTCWSTARPASRSAWRPTSPRTTCARSPTACSGRWSTPTPPARSCLAALMERVKGPDFPNGALIVGKRGIEEAYRTGRGSITMRAVVEVEEDRHGPHLPRGHRAAVPGQPRQPRAEDRRARRLRQGAGHRGHARRLLLAHRPPAGRRAQARRGGAGGAQQPLQAHPAAGQTSAANMLALVDGVPRTLQAGPVRPALGRPPDRGHPAPYRAPAAATPRSRRTSTAAWSRRWTRWTR